MDMDLIFTVDVGWTNTRPVRADAHVTRLRLPATSDRDAMDFALSWVASRPGTWWSPVSEMPTSFKIVQVEEA